MACPHLSRGSWGSSSVCELTRKELEGWTANNVCDTWSKYYDCADYKNGHSGCFITTAVCTATGRGHNCPELIAMRRLRDEWLEAQAFGPKEIGSYYRVAPIICSAIDQDIDPERVYADIYDQWIEPCTTMVDDEDFPSAYDAYKEMLTQLSARYLDDPSQ